MGKRNWIDYKEIKQNISMKMVLEKYDIFNKLRKSGSNLVGVCPIHKGHNDRQFSVNLDRNIWRCFGDCQGGGNVIDFVSKMENLSLHKAGLKIKEWFPGKQTITTKKKNPQKNKPKDKKALNETVNLPLKFQLKLNPEHPFFEKKKLSTETVKQFGLGFASKGIMKNRIAIPIHDDKNQLIAYCGRSITEEQSSEEGKYKLPKNFSKTRVVYNLNRLSDKTDVIIIVESFFSVFQLHQAGYSNIVALMGSELSQAQEDLILKILSPNARIILMFDYDESGIKCTEKCLIQFGKKRYVKAIDFEEYGIKPHNLSEQELQNLLKVNLQK